MIGWSSLDETYGKYSLAPTDDLVRFWRSKVRSQQAVDAVKASTSTLSLILFSDLFEVGDFSVIRLHTKIYSSEIFFASPCILRFGNTEEY